MWFPNATFYYMFKVEFVTLVSSKVPSGWCAYALSLSFFLSSASNLPFSVWCPFEKVVASLLAKEERKRKRERERERLVAGGERKKGGERERGRKTTTMNEKEKSRKDEDRRTLICLLGSSYASGRKQSKLCEQERGEEIIRNDV